MTGLPRIADASLPAEIRAGTDADRKAYRAAIGFESVLVDQLLKTAKLGGPLADGPHGGAVRDAMGAALAGGGGLGLAGQLYRTMRPEDDPA
jgi:Rod binding domain-containing protein